MIINPNEHSHKDNYKLLIGSIVPRPIAFVSTQSTEGQNNLAPFSFFTAITSDPPTICFAPTRRGREGTKKDTLRNIEETGEFVVNIVTEDIVAQMNETATDFPPEIDEFVYSGLTPAASQIVKPPRVLESPINMECKLYKVVSVGPEAAGGGALVIGEVVLFHVADNLIENFRINHDLLKPVGRLAGTDYSTLGRRFALERKPYIAK
jgi:flavin reductase (DIM6/NTAB) family NADH-FMN oxidoreductase RutF